MDDTGAEFREVVRPNRSLSRQALMNVVLVYCAVVLLIGSGFALVGAWPVLPFVGLEIAVVAVAIRLIADRAGDYEEIVVSGDRLEIVQVVAGKECRYQFQRYWARVRLEQDDADWYPSRLLVGSHGRWIEIGAATSAEQRQALRHRLERALRGTRDLAG